MFDVTRIWTNPTRRQPGERLKHQRVSYIEYDPPLYNNVINRFSKLSRVENPQWYLVSRDDHVLVVTHSGSKLCFRRD